MLKWILKIFKKIKSMLGLGIGIEHQHDTRLHIGMDHQGGIIFYLDGSGGGFICTAADLGNPAWGCSGSVITGADSPSIGAGAQNTIDILAECTTADIAADKCRDLSLNGYTDWFLPSKNELDAMYDNLHVAGLGGFTSSYYWSSTEVDSAKAWRQYFPTGAQSNGFKNGTYYVRAVRAF